MSDKFMPVMIREGRVNAVVSPTEIEVAFSDPRKSEKTVVRNLSFSGNGNSFLLAPPQIGTRVAIAFLGDQSKEPVMIVGMFPNESQSLGDDTILPKNELPLGTVSYPNINPGEVILSSQSQNTLELLDNHLAITNNLNRGLHLKTEGKYATLYHNINNYFSYGSGGRTFFGQARRFLDKTSGLSVKVTGINENLDIDTTTDPVGFFPGSIASKLSDNFDGRNIGLVEYKKIINEFDGEFFFDSFYGEIQKILKNRSEFFGAATYSKSKDPMNVLALSDNELIEIIAGSLIDVNGNILDINYRKFLIGNEEGRVPPISNNLEAILDQFVRKSRRGVGFHFQLNTSNPPDNSEPERSKKYENNFVFDIDKEGAFRLNVPKTTPTGNIFFPIGATLGKEDDGAVSSYQINQSQLEEIPVHLRDENGDPISPNLASLLENKKRQTGVKFYNKDSSYPEGYFPFVENEESPDAFIRVQYTKHHDITKIAERLIANTIKSINRPGDNVDPNTGINSATAIYSKPFETPNKDDVDMTSLPYSTISVLPGPPGIRTGGDTIVAGKLRGFDPTEYPDATSKRDLPLTNVLKSIISDAGTTLAPEEADSVQTSGRSSSINLEGSAEVSIGKDSPDGKSLVLDTAGSLIAWLGKDENGRSMILQSDGEVIFNIGGSYNNATDASTANMNKGSFTLRVNVSDRGFYNSKYSSQEKKDLSFAEDYIIHISENGLLISGGAAEKDMIIRNTGDIILESSRGAIELRGSKIYATEHHKKKKDVYQVNDKLQK